MAGAIVLETNVSCVQSLDLCRTTREQSECQSLLYMYTQTNRRLSVKRPLWISIFDF